MSNLCSDVGGTKAVRPSSHSIPLPGGSVTPELGDSCLDELPDTDTVYSVARNDMSHELIILSHPDMGGCYPSFELSTKVADNFDYVGRQHTGSKAWHFLMAGPGWTAMSLQGWRRPRSRRHRASDDCSFGRSLDRLTSFRPSDGVRLS
jgi:hypothetical protein